MTATFNPSVTTIYVFRGDPVQPVRPVRVSSGLPIPPVGTVVNYKRCQWVVVRIRLDIEEEAFLYTVTSELVIDGTKREVAQTPEDHASPPYGQG